ncbi:uncharacterized protein [Temnothorax nylanderi]|uniref:uncharacterized protein n=1 Tax=Temnothorax nylanderi TaxID=102681 RepID=UPI003A89C415
MSQTSTHALSPIEKLISRENFTTWKFAMQSYLELEDLWDCVRGANLDEKKCTRARAKIILSVDPVNYIHLQRTKTPKEAWEKLREVFDDTDLTRKVGLLRKLVTTQLENCSSVEEYVNQIITTAHQLNGVGLEVKDEWIGTLLLAGLSDSYKPMIMGLESSGMPITKDSIKTKLLQEVRSDSAKPKSSEPDAAFLSKQKQKKKLKCFSCHQFGHIAPKCPQKEKPKNKKTNEPKAFFTGNATGKAEDWLIDSGASSHMTGDREWYKELKKCENTKIKVANNARLSR